MTDDQAYRDTCAALAGIKARQRGGHPRQTFAQAYDDAKQELLERGVPFGRAIAEARRRAEKALADRVRGVRP